jgi:hypothetical protein
MAAERIVTLTLALLATAVAAQAQSPASPPNYFGVARYHYAFLPEDGVFYWDDLEGSEAASVQYARAISDRIISPYYAIEFTLATVNRAVHVSQPSATFNANSTIFGFQGSVGPRVKWGPLAVFALGGMNAVRVTETRDSITQGQSRTRWVGVSGISQYWAAVYNQMTGGAPSDTFTFPAYTRFSPSATLGASLDIRRIRVSFEQIRVFASPARTDNRIGIGISY